jgi:uncharacterized protein
MNTKQKYEMLKKYISALDNLIIAFSGGTDSTFLLKTAHEVLGNKIIAVTAKSCSFPQRELNETIAFCEKESIRQIICNLEELNIDGFSRNPTNRCYLCKKELFAKIWSVAKDNDIYNVSEASNIDDDRDYRPGLKAVSEYGVKSPLRHAKLTKDEIRSLSKKLGLSTWNKQPFACLISRFPYGENITLQRLSMIDRAEQLLLDIGLRQVRVRHHGNLARIETDELGFNILTESKQRTKVYKQFKEIGFTYVAIDIIGYRTGSMNETLPINIVKSLYKI